ncbi:unnamed protein product [Adineta ricciae]|uniref:Bulb-type lectin domain-containing protein n=1 Tax=Adineta ricciae TaxID=249248 RepID=A0A815PT17_ADIRI|nr:unnamed protein product [Adineta ricciae]CAF1453539.1 unnamed protein product [Adineta ricciae]
MEKYSCELYIINAGRGDAAVFIEQHKNGKARVSTMIDCGPYEASPRFIKLLEFLDLIQISDTVQDKIILDNLILTHQDKDHTQLIGTLLRNNAKIEIENIYVSSGCLSLTWLKELAPKYEKTKATSFYDFPFLHIAGQRYSDKNNDEIYHYYKSFSSNEGIIVRGAHRTPEIDSNKENAESILTYYVHPEYKDTKRILFTGDSQAEIVKKRCNDSKIKLNGLLLFKVPHHGSRFNNFDPLNGYHEKFILKDMRVKYVNRAIGIFMICYHEQSQKNKDKLTHDHTEWYDRFASNMRKGLADASKSWTYQNIIQETLSNDIMIKIMNGIIQLCKDVASEFGIEQMSDDKIERIQNMCKRFKSFLPPNMHDDVIEFHNAVLTTQKFLLRDFFGYNQFMSSLWWRHLVALFYKEVNASNYVISCYDEYGHPHMETIAGIIQAAQVAPYESVTILITNTSTNLLGKESLLRTEMPEIAGDTLPLDTILEENHGLLSKNRKYWLLMQNDGNLVIYTNVYLKGVTSIYNFGYGPSTRLNPYFLAIMPDGFLVVSDTDKHIYWAWPETLTTKEIPAKMVIQDDGTLCLYSENGVAMWTLNFLRNIFH